KGLRPRRPELQGLGAAVGAIGEPGNGGEHTEPAEEADSVADFLVVEEEVPLAEEEQPIAGFGADEGQGVHAGVGHVGADVEKVFEEPEGRKSEAVGLALEEEIDGVEPGVEEEEDVESEPGPGAEAGDGFPFSEVFVEPVHEDRVATGGVN